MVEATGMSADVIRSLPCLVWCISSRLDPKLHIHNKSYITFLMDVELYVYDLSKVTLPQSSISCTLTDSSLRVLHAWYVQFTYQQSGHKLGLTKIISTRNP